MLVVLVVEDDKHLGEEVVIQMAKRGWKAEWFRTPEEFDLRMAYKDPWPNVVLTDWDFNMFSPKKGDYVVKKCQELNIPVVLYSGIIRREAADLGCPMIGKSRIRDVLDMVADAGNVGGTKDLEEKV